MAGCCCFIRHDNAGAAHDAPTLLDEQDAISVPPTRRKGKGRITFLVQTLVSRTKHAINDITRSLHRKVDVTDSLESEWLHGREHSDDDSFSTVDSMGGSLEEDDDSFSTADSMGGNLEDKDGADIEGSEGRIGASDVLPEGDHIRVAYLPGEFSKCKQRIKELTGKIAQMEKNLEVKRQKEKKLTRQVKGLVAELLESKETIKENSGVEIFLRQKILFAKVERAFRKQTIDFLARKVLELKHLIEEHECKICYSRPRNVVIYPCLHAQYCSTCIKRLMNMGRECPSCRGYIKRVLPTW